MSSKLLRMPVIGVLVVVLLSGCGGDDGAGNRPDPDGGAGATAGQSMKVGGGDALIWGDGSYAVVLAHGAAFDAESWTRQAARIAEQGMVALAVEDTAPQSILAAAEYLQTERGAKDVALVGGSAGADAILEAASREPDAPDQLILLSANQTADGLGAEPKLFIASEGEAVADVSRELARTSPGDENEAQILPGDAHAQNIFDTDQAERVTRSILERLERFSAS